MSKLIGEIFVFPVTPPPAGCVECGGQELNRITYADLFRVIGESYGSGDGTTTFNIPDLCGRVVVGRDGMGGVLKERLVSNVEGEPDGAIGSVGGHGSATVVSGSLAGEPLTAASGTDVTIPNLSGSVEFTICQPLLTLSFCIFTGVF